jgi:hypothetical protein
MRGGRRDGAGRPRGSLDKFSKLVSERLAASADQTPLDLLLSIMRDESQNIRIRLRAAKAAAPYVHPKLGIRS